MSYIKIKVLLTLRYVTVPQFTPVQSPLELVCLDDLVPQDHLLRMVDKPIDFYLMQK